MKTTKLFSLIGTTLVGLGVTAWAGPHGPGGGFAGGGHFGGFSGGIRAAPTFSGGSLRFSGNRSIGGLSRAPQQFSYYGGAPRARTPELTQHAVVRQQPKQSTTPYAGTRATTSRQQPRVGSVARQNTRVANSQMTAAAVRRAVANHDVSARHDANWHRDWDKHRAHFHNGLVFVFIDGFWWGLSPAYFPWDYYPYYAYGDYPYDYYNYSPYDYDQQPAYDSDQYGNNTTVSAVQSALAKLGYYRGAIDGAEGDETQAAIARYQEDHDLSVTGTVTAAILQSLGLASKAS
jgi:hypothetical protein